MSYSPATDLLGLLRLTSGGVRFVRTPGLDYVLAALARADVFVLSVEQTAPTEQRETTVWLRTAPQSWAAEGAVFLFNTATQEYEPATIALWAALFTAVAPSPTVFQNVTTGAAAVGAATTLLAIQRATPALTTLTLPAVALRNRPLQVADWSTAIAEHQILLNAAGGETIMRAASFKLFSTADQLAGVTLYPSTNLNGWVIAP